MNIVWYKIGMYKIIIRFNLEIIKIINIDIGPHDENTMEYDSTKSSIRNT